MAGALAAFAWTGDPSANGLDWSEWTNDGDGIMVFDLDESTMRYHHEDNLFRRNECGKCRLISLPQLIWSSARKCPGFVIFAGTVPMRRLKVDKIKKDEYYMKKRLLSGLLAVMMVCLSIMTVASAAPATHTVVAGDSLSSLAQRYLGSADRWKEIYEANRDVISDPNSIYVGQQLRIPGGSSTAPDEGRSPRPTRAAPPWCPPPRWIRAPSPGSSSPRTWRSMT